MMTRIIRSILLAGSFICILLISSSALAQKISTVNQEQISADDLTDEMVAQILAEQGIPLTGNFAAVEEAGRYTLGVNDVIQISVSRHPEVSAEYMINSEGIIQYEFVGDIKLEGLTKKEAAATLTAALGEYIISPEVNVKITGYNSKVVYVIGEVGRPGKIFMRGDTITVREALVQASLPLLTAKAEKSRLITPSADGNPKQIMVNIDRLLYEGDLKQNYVMKPGDTLYIPPTVMAKAMRIIQPVASPITTTAGAGRAVTTGF